MGAMTGCPGGKEKRGSLRDPLGGRLQRGLLAAMPILVVIRIALVRVIIAIALRVVVHVLLLSICVG
jgi:hypothetical protein